MCNNQQLHIFPLKTCLAHLCRIDLSRIPTNNGVKSRSGWTKLKQMYENLHPSLTLVQLFLSTKVKCGKLKVSEKFRNKPGLQGQHIFVCLWLQGYTTIHQVSCSLSCYLDEDASDVLEHGAAY